MFVSNVVGILVTSESSLSIQKLLLLLAVFPQISFLVMVREYGMLVVPLLLLLSLPSTAGKSRSFRNGVRTHWLRGRSPFSLRSNPIHLRETPLIPIDFQGSSFLSRFLTRYTVKFRHSILSLLSLVTNMPTTSWLTLFQLQINCWTKDLREWNTRRSDKQDVVISFSWDWTLSNLCF